MNYKGQFEALPQLLEIFRIPPASDMPADVCAHVQAICCVQFHDIFPAVFKAAWDRLQARKECGSS